MYQICKFSCQHYFLFLSCLTVILKLFEYTVHQPVFILLGRKESRQALTSFVKANALVTFVNMHSLIILSAMIF